MYGANFVLWLRKNIILSIFYDLQLNKDFTYSLLIGFFFLFFFLKKNKKKKKEASSKTKMKRDAKTPPSQHINFKNQMTIKLK